MSMSAPRKSPNELNGAEVQFCYEYLANGRNGTKAYQKVHPNVEYGSAHSIASRWLQKVTIREFLKKLEEDAFSKLNITIERTMREAAKMAYLDLDKNIPKAKLKRIEVASAAKNKGIDTLARMQKMYQPDTYIPGDEDGVLGTVIVRLPPLKRM
jgi:hypothetical protein